METKRLKDLKPGEMFRRPTGTYRYVVSPNREGSFGDLHIYCYNLDGASDGYWIPGSYLVLRIPLVPKLEELSRKEEPSEPESFYMCYTEGGGTPAVKHSGGAARREAERLSRATKHSVFVLKAVASVKYIAPSGPCHHWTKLV